MGSWGLLLLLRLLLFILLFLGSSDLRGISLSIITGIFACNIAVRGSVGIILDYTTLLVLLLDLLKRYITNR